MIKFSVNTRNSLLTGILCVGVLTSGCFFSGCAQDHTATDEAPLPNHPTTEETVTPTFPEIQALVETGVVLTEPEETVDMSLMMEDASISVLSRDGMIGEYDFFTCNETQLFGDFSIALAEYAGEEYLMLSGGGIALLAKEDGSDAMLFYNDQRLDLPFPCYFNLDYEFLALHPGDFLQNGGRQLAMVIPMETGSGVDVDQLQIIDLDTMSLVPIHTQQDSYAQEMYSLFDAHFTQTHPGLPYELFQFIQYSIEDGLIFVEYGACDADGNYLCFLEASLSYNGAMIALDDDMTFQDHMQ